VREVFALWIQELGNDVSVHARSERTDVELVQLGYVLQKLFCRRTYPGMIPRHHITMTKLEVVHTLQKNYSLLYYRYCDHQRKATSIILQNADNFWKIDGHHFITYLPLHTVDITHKIVLS
jgi:hypothetical protein